MQNDICMRPPALLSSSGKKLNTLEGGNMYLDSMAGQPVDCGSPPNAWGPYIHKF